MLNCAACHGPDLKGNAAVGFPSLIDIGKRKTRAEIEQVTRQGGGRMPGYATMGEAKIADASTNSIHGQLAAEAGVNLRAARHAVNIMATAKSTRLVVYRP